MQWLRGIALAVLLAWPASAQTSLFRVNRKTSARLVLSHEVARPGETVMAGVELSMPQGWHTYWVNAGDSGDATKIHWGLPPEIQPGDIQWPVPEKYTAADLTTYVYHDRAVLLVPLKIEGNAASGARELKALVKWLECEKVCLPGSNLVSATLTIGAETKLADTNFFAEAQRRLPLRGSPGNVTARWDQPAGGQTRAFIIEWETDAVSPDFFPFANPLATISGSTEVLPGSSGRILLRKTAEKLGNDWPREIAGLLIRSENNRNVGYEISVPLNDSPGASIVSPASAPIPVRSLAMWLVYAFIGGLILNIMPCVLPVIALKILGFVAQSREHPKRVRALGVLYTLGVITSFLVLAGIVISIKAAGQKAGWGMQLSNAPFVAALTVIVTLIALNLFGVFEITLGGRAMAAASGAATRHGSAGAFMNGVLATVLATSCTAPVLGAAVGFAFTQNPPVIVLFFTTIGLGLAAPYLLLSFQPRWLKVLPKPGPWMDRFKVIMGFPMLATAVWLFSIATALYGDPVLWLGLFVVVVALAAWIYGEFVQRGGGRRVIAATLVALLLGAGYLYALEHKMHWRAPLAQTAQADTFQEMPGGIVWHRWSADAVAKARADGHPVLVDFTAKWCLTCQLNKNSSLEIPSVREKLRQVNAIPFLGDYTRYPPEITAELEKYGRAGVPLVLVFPKDPSKPAIVLPELLTPGIVLAALEQAAQ